jgi:hypothetical protein
MKQPNPSSEFRSVHAARAALKAYVANKRDINIIHTVTNIDRFDVWQCVFEKEPVAYRELQIKEFYDMALKYDDTPIKMTATLFVTMLSKLIEFKLPLSLEDGIQVVVDALGENSIPHLLKQAKWLHSIREGIVSKYNRPDTEWLGQTKQLVVALEKVA